MCDVCLCVCACKHAVFLLVCMREKEGERKRERECVCVCVCVCVLDGEGNMVVASRIVVVLLMAVHPTSYTDCLTSLSCEPLSPLYRCHTSLKNVKRDH